MISCPKMMLLFFILPAVVRASISVDIITEYYRETPDLIGYLLGDDNGPVTEKEKLLFGLDNDTILAGATTLLGQRPDHISFKNQIVRSTAPYNITLVNTNLGSPKVLAEKLYENKEGTSKKIFIELSKTEDIKMNTVWSNKDDINTGSVKVRFALHLGNMLLVQSEEFEWGQNYTAQKQHTIEAWSDINVKLQPGESVKAQLEANKGDLTIEINYVSTLSGKVVAHYDNGFNGLVTHDVDINDILRTNKLPETKKSSQRVELDVYYNERIVVTNIKNGVTVYTSTTPKHKKSSQKRLGSKHLEEHKGKKVVLALPENSFL